MMEYNAYFPRYTDRYLESVEISLVEKDLWEKFHKCGTEMVITKGGRNVFPHFNFKVAGLNPDVNYSVYIDFQLAANSRFKYVHGCGWQPVGQAETQSPLRVIPHSDSPMTGAQWMRGGINFKSLKITNSPHAGPGQVVLNSMHKYQPKLIIVAELDPITRLAASKEFVLKETQFVAVTAYQNADITNLKIGFNKFAKGFRDDGKANTKRKRERDTASSDEPKEKKSLIVKESTPPPESTSPIPTPHTYFSGYYPALYYPPYRVCYYCLPLSTRGYGSPFQPCRCPPLREEIPRSLKSESIPSSHDDEDDEEEIDVESPEPPPLSFSISAILGV